MILLVCPGSDKISRRPSDDLVARGIGLPAATVATDPRLVEDFLERISTLSFCSGVASSLPLPTRYPPTPPNRRAPTPINILVFMSLRCSESNSMTNKKLLTYARITPNPDLELSQDQEVAMAACQFLAALPCCPHAEPP